MPNKDCPKLRECPLCGSEANIVGGPEDWHPTSYDPDSGGDPYSIVCTGCECGMLLAFWDIDEAIKAWNRRADHSGEANGMVSNADKIRSMSDEELAKNSVYCIQTPDYDEGMDGEWCECGFVETWHSTLCLICCYDEESAVEQVIYWLRKPAKEENL